MNRQGLQRLLLRIATITVIPLLAGGCVLFHGQTDQGTDIVSRLQIEIPESATDITGNTDTGVNFLMPNDQWRSYIDTYYPDKQLLRFPADKETNGSVPLWCIPAFRSGVQLFSFTTGAKIPYGDNDRQQLRGVVVTPDCEPGKAYVQWVLGDPE